MQVQMRGQVNFNDFAIENAPLEQVVREAVASVGCELVEWSNGSNHVLYKVVLPPSIAFLPDAEVAAKAATIRDALDRAIIEKVESWYKKEHGRLPGELRSEAASLLTELASIKSGKVSASKYEVFLPKAFDFIFRGDIAHIRSQTQVDGGRKRIDLTFSNVSAHGFLHWMSTHAKVYCPW